MPKYQYSCGKCSSSFNAISVIGPEIYNADTMKPGYHPETGEYIFFIECSMKDKPTKPKCPSCMSNESVSVNFTDLDIQCYVRGDGLVKDKAGARRDMNRHKLKYEDPYKSMRVSGEKDYLDNKFRRGGMDLSVKSNTTSIKLAQGKRAEELQKEVDSLNDIEKKIIIHVFKNEGSTTTELSKYSDDVNKYLTGLNNKYIYYNSKDQTWAPLAEGNRIFEVIIGI